MNIEPARRRSDAQGVPPPVRPSSRTHPKSPAGGRLAALRMEFERQAGVGVGGADGLSPHARRPPLHPRGVEAIAGEAVAASTGSSGSDESVTDSDEESYESSSYTRSLTPRFLHMPGVGLLSLSTQQTGTNPIALHARGPNPERQRTTTQLPFRSLVPPVAVSRELPTLTAPFCGESFPSSPPPLRAVAVVAESPPDASPATLDSWGNSMQRSVSDLTAWTGAIVINGPGDGGHAESMSGCLGTGAGGSLSRPALGSGRLSGVPRRTSGLSGSPSRVGGDVGEGRRRNGRGDSGACPVSPREGAPRRESAPAPAPVMPAPPPPPLLSPSSPPPMVPASTLTRENLDILASFASKKDGYGGGGGGLGLAMSLTGPSLVPPGVGGGVSRRKEGEAVGVAAAVHGARDAAPVVRAVPRPAATRCAANPTAAATAATTTTTTTTTTAAAPAAGEPARAAPPQGQGERRAVPGLSETAPPMAAGGGGALASDTGARVSPGAKVTASTPTPTTHTPAHAIPPTRVAPPPRSTAPAVSSAAPVPPPRLAAAPLQAAATAAAAAVPPTNRFLSGAMKLAVRPPPATCKREAPTAPIPSASSPEKERGVRGPAAAPTTVTPASALARGATAATGPAAAVARAGQGLSPSAGGARAPAAKGPRSPAVAATTTKAATRAPTISPTLGVSAVPSVSTSPAPAPARRHSSVDGIKSSSDGVGSAGVLASVGSAMTGVSTGTLLPSAVGTTTPRGRRRRPPDRPWHGPIHSSESSSGTDPPPPPQPRLLSTAHRPGASHSNVSLPPPPSAATTIAEEGEVVGSRRGRETVSPLDSVRRTNSLDAEGNAAPVMMMTGGDGGEVGGGRSEPPPRTGGVGEVAERVGSESRTRSNRRGRPSTTAHERPGTRMAAVASPCAPGALGEHVGRAAVPSGTRLTMLSSTQPPEEQGLTLARETAPPAPPSAAAAAVDLTESTEGRRRRLMPGRRPSVDVALPSPDTPSPDSPATPAVRPRRWSAGAGGAAGGGAARRLEMVSLLSSQVLYPAPGEDLVRRQQRLRALQRRRGTQPVLMTDLSRLADWVPGAPSTTAGVPPPPPQPTRAATATAPPPPPTTTTTSAPTSRAGAGRGESRLEDREGMAAAAAKTDPARVLAMTDTPTPTPAAGSVMAGAAGVARSSSVASAAVGRPRAAAPSALTQTAITGAAAAATTRGEAPQRESTHPGTSRLPPITAPAVALASPEAGAAPIAAVARVVDRVAYFNHVDSPRVRADPPRSLDAGRPGSTAASAVVRRQPSQPSAVRRTSRSAEAVRASADDARACVGPAAREGRRWVVPRTSPSPNPSLDCTNDPPLPHPQGQRGRVGGEVGKGVAHARDEDAVVGFHDGGGGGGGGRVPRPSPHAHSTARPGGGDGRRAFGSTAPVSLTDARGAVAAVGLATRPGAGSAGDRCGGTGVGEAGLHRN